MISETSIEARSRTSGMVFWRANELSIRFCLFSRIVRRACVYHYLSVGSNIYDARSSNSKHGHFWNLGACQH